MFIKNCRQTMHVWQSAKDTENNASFFNLNYLILFKSFSEYTSLTEIYLEDKIDI